MSKRPCASLAMPPVKKTPSPQTEDLTHCLKLLSSQLLTERFRCWPFSQRSKIKSGKTSSRLCSLGDLSGYEVRVEQLRRSDPVPNSLLRTICGSVLFASSRALTFWICSACSFTIAARTVIPDFSSAIVFSCSSTFRCSLRNSLSNIALTA